MSRKSRHDTLPVVAILPEDMELIKAMVALPKEKKVFARGVILGLGLTGDVAGLFEAQPSA